MVQGLPRGDEALNVTLPLTRRLGLLALLLATLVTVLGPARAVRAAGDDYPWRTDTTHSADTFGFTKRQCVSYAAWRLARAGHRISNVTVVNGRAYTWGSAATWDTMALRLGKPVRTYAKYGKAAPRVGSIAQWNAHEASPWWTPGGLRGTFTAGSLGHVAYVAAVYSDGSVLVRQYNVGSTPGTYSTMRVKAPRYLVV